MSRQPQDGESDPKLSVLRLGNRIMASAVVTYTAPRQRGRRRNATGLHAPKQKNGALENIRENPEQGPTSRDTPSSRVRFL